MTRKKFRGTEDQFRKALLKWLSDKHQQLRANVHGDDDTSEWCKDEADLVEQHIQTVEGLIFVNDALKASDDEAHRQADLAYDRIEELENRLEKEMSDLDAADRRITRLQARIQELEERLKAATDDAKEAETYAGELEVKMAKAVEALGTALSEMVDYADTHPAWSEIWEAREAARTTLAELTGGKDE